MTGLQDDICDALMGARIGARWVGGPLHVAALVIDPAFVPQRRGDRLAGDFARALGWPAALCEAVSGANSALRCESDRRALAVTLFGRVPTLDPGEPVPLPDAIIRPAAVWAVMRAHESACATDCPLRTAHGDGWTNPFYGDILCSSAAGVATDGVWADSPAAYHAAVALFLVHALLMTPRARSLLLKAVREAARAETKVRGAEGAADFCLGLAARLGLACS